MNGAVVLLFVTAITFLLVAAYLLLETDYETRRDMRRMEQRQRAVDARRRTMRVLP